ncbi:MAG: precorrin-8X methylmutase [Candidatus Humimicrobiaceae bacterium]
MVVATNAQFLGEAAPAAAPALIISVPVGFVGACESKKKLLTLKVPYITNQSRKGGSSVACAIVNALLKIARKEEENESLLKITWEEENESK